MSGDGGGPARGSTGRAADDAGPDDAGPDEPGNDRPGVDEPGTDTFDDRPVRERVELAPAQEVAAAALARARAAAKAKGLRPGSPGRRPTTRTGDDLPHSGPGPSRRDPSLFGASVEALVEQWGWREEISVGGVIGRWEQVVGPQVAEHCQPETFEDGVLVVRADSTAWAVQVRRLAPHLVARIAEELGAEVVREVKVLGPAGPGWGKGALRVPGRGPRDTYG